MAQAQAETIEYTIYTFDRPAPETPPTHSWKRHATLADMQQAMIEAAQLHRTQKFQKIEVKKKFFDEKQNRKIAMTLKVYEARRGGLMGFFARFWPGR